MNSTLRRTVSIHRRLGCVDYAGRNYVAKKLTVMKGAHVIVQPSDFSVAFVQVFSATTYLSICYARNQKLWLGTPHKRQMEIIAKLMEHGPRRTTEAAR